MSQGVVVEGRPGALSFFSSLLVISRLYLFHHGHTYSLALNSSMALELCGIRRTKEESKKSMLQFLLWAHVIMGYVQHPLDPRNVLNSISIKLYEDLVWYTRQCNLFLYDVYFTPTTDFFVDFNGCLHCCDREMHPHGKSESGRWAHLLQEVEGVEALIPAEGSLIWDVIIMRDTVMIG
ncbi:hypothetical protein C8J56DRAFT_891445 [Mycena floridula]|nr:hypothetical protein C8J56DRAFT_891445 [Mycena floridula]